MGQERTELYVLPVSGFIGSQAAATLAVDGGGHSGGLPERVGEEVGKVRTPCVAPREGPSESLPLSTCSSILERVCLKKYDDELGDASSICPPNYIQLYAFPIFQWMI